MNWKTPPIKSIDSICKAWHIYSTKPVSGSWVTHYRVVQSMLLNSIKPKKHFVVLTMEQMLALFKSQYFQLTTVWKKYQTHTIQKLIRKTVGGLGQMTLVLPNCSKLHQLVEWKWLAPCQFTFRRLSLQQFFL